MQSVDLMPIALRRRRFLLDRVRVWGGLLACVSLALAGSSRYLSWRVHNLQEALAGESQMSVEIVAAKDSNNRLATRRTQLRAKQEQLRRLIQRSNWANAIREVADATGQNILLTDIKIERPKNAPTGQPKEQNAPSQSPPTLKLTGYALSNAEFANYLARLNQCTLLHRVEPVESRVTQLGDGTLIVFSVDCQLSASSLAPDTQTNASLPKTMHSQAGRRGAIAK